ncbi:MAG TPA: hypothetical protein GX010_01800 [Erysipelotrichaceae bacterium]|nr:hypothetical protein [Erysipelotrichaceae bacterium]
MIMIIGSQHDDILYYETIMSNKKQEVVLEKYTITIGTIFNRSVLLVYEAKTNYVSSALTLYLIEKYYVILVLMVGRCVAYTKDIKPTEIAISKYIIAGDVDQVNEDNVKLGQIPGFPQVFDCNEDVIGYLTSAFEKRTMSAIKISNYISTSVDYHSSKQVSHIREFDNILGFDKNIVFDCNSAGIAMVSSLRRVPFVSVKVVERYLDDKSDINSYLKAIKHYSEIGKAIVTCIGDIGRNEIITGEGAY